VKIICCAQVRLLPNIAISVVAPRGAAHRAFAHRRGRACSKKKHAASRRGGGVSKQQTDDIGRVGCVSMVLRSSFKWRRARKTNSINASPLRLRAYLYGQVVGCAWLSKTWFDIKMARWLYGGISKNGRKNMRIKCNVFLHVSNSGAGIG